LARARIEALNTLPERVLGSLATTITCVCVCVCVRERERERECVCMCVQPRVGWPPHRCGCGPESNRYGVRLLLKCPKVTFIM
jgi:hypothetical protein